MAIHIKPPRRARQERAPWHFITIDPSTETDPDGMLSFVFLAHPEEADAFLIAPMPRGADAALLGRCLASMLDSLNDNERPEAVQVTPAELAATLAADPELEDVQISAADAAPHHIALLADETESAASFAVQGGLFGVQRRHADFVRLAQRIYALAPWSVFGEEEVLCLEGEGIGEESYPCALVQGEEEEGAESIALYASFADLWRTFGPRFEGDLPGRHVVLEWREGGEDPLPATFLLESWGVEAGLIPMLSLPHEMGRSFFEVLEEAQQDEEGEELDLRGILPADQTDLILARLEAIALHLEQLQGLRPEEMDADLPPVTLPDGSVVSIQPRELDELEGADAHRESPDFSEALEQLEGFFDEEAEYDLRLAAVPPSLIKAASWEAVGLPQPDDEELEIPAVVFYLPRQQANPRKDLLKSVNRFATLFDGVSGLHMLVTTEGSAWPKVLDVLDVEDQDELDDLMEVFEDATDLGLVAIVFAQPGPAQDAPLRERDVHLAWPVRVSSTIPRLPQVEQVEGEEG